MGFVQVLFGVNQRLRVEDVDSPLVNVRPVKNVLLVVVTGDRGLCGGYNNFVLKKVIVLDLFESRIVWPGALPKCRHAGLMPCRCCCLSDRVMDPSLAAMSTSQGPLRQLSSSTDRWMVMAPRLTQLLAHDRRRFATRSCRRWGWA